MVQIRIRELDKTILLAFLVLTKGSLDTYLKEDEITSKFARRKGKMIRYALNRLVRAKLLSKHPKENKYKFTQEGLNEAKKVLYQGAKLWKK